MSLIALYLGAIVTANLAVAEWGQAALPFTAFLLIPLDLITRDILHERWKGDRLAARMAALILCGSVLATVLNLDARWVAVASFVAFGTSTTVNALVFWWLDAAGHDRFTRMNGSNALAAITDSAIFPLVAFGPADTSLQLCAAQAAAKFTGGLLFTWLYVRRAGN